MKPNNYAPRLRAGILITMFAALLAACDDSTDLIGSSVIEGIDNIDVKRTTYYMQSSTVRSDTTYSRGSTAYIGKYTHPDFGSFEAGFMTQFNVTEEFRIPSLNAIVPDGGKQEFLNTPNVYERSFTPKRCYVAGLYTSYFGDSLAVGRINVYKLNRDLVVDDDEDIYYSNINPEDYYSQSDLLGSTSYSPVNLSVPTADRTSNYLFLTVDIPTSVGKQIMDLYKECQVTGQSFRTRFLEEFKGIYAKQIQGDGALLYLDQVRLYLDFDSYSLDEHGLPALNSASSADSIAHTSFGFSTTKEIVQVNTFRNNTPDDLLSPDTITYLKSPAGLYTRVQLPLRQIASEILDAGDSLNSASSADSIAHTSFGFSTTKEIVQVNTFRNNTPDDLLLPDSLTYLKSPAGLYTRVQLPLRQIASEILDAGDSLNTVSFTVFVDTLNAKLDALKPPGSVLLLRDTATIGGAFHNYQKTFFADNTLPDNQTSFLASSGPKGYSFGGIDKLILTAIKEYKAANEEVPEHLNLLLIPVNITYDGNSTTAVAVSHNMTPSYTILQGGNDLSSKKIRLSVYHCKY